MEKIKVYGINMHNQICTFDRVDGLIEAIKDEVENMDKNTPLSFEVKTLEMTKEQYAKLPEFTGY